jgi:hypothetical protein
MMSCRSLSEFDGVIVERLGGEEVARVDGQRAALADVRQPRGLDAAVRSTDGQG